MKRSPLVTIVNVLQLLLGILLATLTIYLLILARSRETRAESDAAGAVRGLLVGALIFGIPAVITLVGFWGLWNGKLWGWVLSLATNVGMIAGFVYSILSDTALDRDMIALGA